MQRYSRYCVVNGKRYDRVHSTTRARVHFNPSPQAIFFRSTVTVRRKK
jgi:hypothetical protein